MTQITFVQIVTHAGPFHPDDVLAAAALRVLTPNASVLRTRDEALLAEAKANPDSILIDVGGEYDVDRSCYDHHQKGGAGSRENGVPFSSLGLIWRHYGNAVVATKLIRDIGVNLDQCRAIAELIDDELIQGVDALDNGVAEPRFRPTLSGTDLPLKAVTLGEAIFALNPQSVLGEEDFDGRFEQAVRLAGAMLDGVVRQCAARYLGHQLLIEGRRVEDKLVVVDKHVDDWSDVVSAEFPETLFLLEPDTSVPGAWMIWQVPTTPRGFEGRKQLPESWAGLRGADLEAVTDIEGSGFCHTYRFCGGAANLEAALMMAKAAIDA